MSPTQPSRILVVDDDVDICHNLSDILGDLGYHVDCAHDGRAGLELAARSPYDVALVDLRMPVMDGLTLAREIRRLCAGTVSILATAWASAETADMALAAGAWKVLEKPLDFPGLLRLLEQALDQPLVLLVDDDQDLCNGLWDLLRERGFRVSLAHEIARAAELLEQARYQIVLVDLRMPDGDGSSLLRIARGANPRSRMIVITGRREEGDQLVERLAALGADAVCFKPFDLPLLLRTLEGLLETEGEAAAKAPPTAP